MKNKPLAIHYQGRQTPHAILEINQCCNISCQSCYKSKSKQSKSLKQIKIELALLCQKRKLEQITLAGGEPSLHPDLLEIIFLCRKKVSSVNMLSNGLGFSPEKCSAMAKAGLSAVHLHIDSHQKRADLESPQKINALRDQYTKILAEAGIDAALSITLYKSDLEKISQSLNYFFKSPFAHNFLITLCKDFSIIAGNIHQKKQNQQEQSPEAVYNSDFEKLMIRLYKKYPDFYLASNLSKKKRKWIFYNSFCFSDHSLQLFPGSGNFNRIFLLADKLSLLFRRKRIFDMRVEQKKVPGLFILSTLLSFNPGYTSRAIKFWKNWRKSMAKLYYKKLYVQEGPTVKEDGRLEFCRSCPDAAIRKERLVPVCLADALEEINFTENLLD